MDYVKFHISFFLSVLSSSIQNIQFHKNQTHDTYVWRGKDHSCKNPAHTRETCQVKRPKFCYC